MMQKGRFDRPWPVLLRYPVVFGSCLLIMGTGFIYRDAFLTDLPERRKKMLQEDPESRAVIKKFIKDNENVDFKH